MTKTLPIAIGALLVLILVLFNTTYVVNYHELAVRTRFGTPAGVDDRPGLHWKLPFFIDQVTKLDTRLQMVESPLETVLLSDNQQVVVQAFVQWRIDPSETGAMEFFRLHGSLEAGNRALEQELPSALARIRSFRFNDLIGAQSKLAQAEDAILEELKAKNLQGIVPVLVGINQIVLPPKTTVAVLGRMAETQKKLATQQESIGVSQSKAIESIARSEADTIRLFAEQWAAQIRARGDAEAARYYEQMKQYGDLAVFLSWLDTLRASLGGSTTFIADTSRAPFHALDLNAPRDENGIPKPTRSAIPGDAMVPAETAGTAASSPVAGSN
jgi:membrane protease subunit HflC